MHGHLNVKHLSITRKTEMLNYWYKILHLHTVEYFLIRNFVFIIMLTQSLFFERSNYSVYFPP